jgi:hypothetical protein
MPDHPQMSRMVADEKSKRVGLYFGRLACLICVHLRHLWIPVFSPIVFLAGSR